MWTVYIYTDRRADRLIISDQRSSLGHSGELKESKGKDILWLCSKLSEKEDLYRKENYLVIQLLFSASYEMELIEYYFQNYRLLLW